MVLISGILSGMAITVIQKVAVSQIQNALGLADNTPGLFSHITASARDTAGIISGLRGEIPGLVRNTNEAIPPLALKLATVLENGGQVLNSANGALPDLMQTFRETASTADQLMYWATFGIIALRESGPLHV
jgi:hypothetical protein